MLSCLQTCSRCMYVLCPFLKNVCPVWSIKSKSSILDQCNAEITVIFQIKKIIILLNDAVKINKMRAHFNKTLKVFQSTTAISFKSFPYMHYTFISYGIIFPKFMLRKHPLLKTEPTGKLHSYSETG